MYRGARWWRLGVLLGLLLAVSGTIGAYRGSAQTPDGTSLEERKQIEARLDSLTLLLRVQRDRVEAAQNAIAREELGRTSLGTDTLHVGPLRIVVLDGRADRARPHFEKAWAQYQPLLVEPGAEANRLVERLQERTFVFQDGFFVKPLELTGERTWVNARPWLREATVAARVRTAVANAVQGTLRLPQATWIDPGMFSREPDWESIYRRLTVGLSAPVVRCRGGELESCWIAMGVTRSEPIQDLSLWYTVEQRRAIGSSGARLNTRKAACERGDMDVCDEGLLELYGQLIPLGGAARATLVSLALEIGGEGALARFAQPVVFPVDFREILSETSGVDADTLMAEWRRRALAAKPDRPHADRQARVGTVLWILLFMTFAARSTRWRLA
jgi:hypothetical protein